MAHSEDCVGRRGASRLSKLEIGHDDRITRLRNHSFESPNAEGRSDCAPGVCLAEGKANAVANLFNTHVRSASPPISASCVLLAMRVPLVNDTANQNCATFSDPKLFTKRHLVSEYKRGKNCVFDASCSRGQ